MMMKRFYPLAALMVAIVVTAVSTGCNGCSYVSETTFNTFKEGYDTDKKDYAKDKEDYAKDKEETKKFREKTTTTLEELDGRIKTTNQYFSNEIGQLGAKLETYGGRVSEVEKKIEEFSKSRSSATAAEGVPLVGTGYTFIGSYGSASAYAESNLGLYAPGTSTGTPQYRFEGNAPDLRMESPVIRIPAPRFIIEKPAETVPATPNQGPPNGQPNNVPPNGGAPTDMPPAKEDTPPQSDPAPMQTPPMENPANTAYYRGGYSYPPAGPFQATTYRQAR